MNSSTLLVVHPGYAIGTIYSCELYGNYNDYISRLKAAVWSQCSIILIDNKKPPFDVPNSAEIIHYKGVLTSSTEELVCKLKSRGITKVNLCGEFLWEYKDRTLRQIQSKVYQDLLWEAEKRRQYGFDDKFPPKQLQPLTKPLKCSWVLEPIDIEKELRLNPSKFSDRVYIPLSGRREVRGCCVKRVYDQLIDKFDVEIVRELCYPAIAPYGSFTN